MTWKDPTAARSSFIAAMLVRPPSERWWTVWKRIERVLFILGIALLALCAAVQLDNYLSYKASLKAFDSGASTAIFARESYQEKSNPQESGHIAPAGKAVVAPGTSQPKQSVAPLAVLQIPNIHLVVPLLNGTDGRTLSRGVGHIAGTAWPGEQGNIGIAGHRDSYFRGLKDIKLGDVIELKTVKGTDKYVVDQIDIVAPKNVGVLQRRAAPTLTLVTCYPFHFIGSAPQRYIVMASFKNEISSGPGNSFPGSASPTQSTNMEENQ